VHVLLLSTYDLGHQPFSLASPAAKLRSAGAGVTCNDLAIDALDEEAVKKAGLIGLYLPMHTATRLSVALLPRLKNLNSKAHIVFYGLYAPLNADYLKSIGGDSFIGGEFEDGLIDIYHKLVTGEKPSAIPLISTAKQEFIRPWREDLPSLDRYAHLYVGDGSTKIVGYTEASRGCKHTCCHCPIVPVYQGRFRILPVDIVLADIRQQIANGAEHISFGDPDFFNGPRHAISVVENLHEEFPDITYDVTIKIEHLLKHQELLPKLKASGCLFITTAVESTEEEILRLLDKGHSQADFKRATEITRAAGLTLAPTFVPFTPWTTKEGFLQLLETIAGLDLIENVAPIQLAIRLLIPNQSALLDLTEIQPHLDGYDEEALSYRWRNSDETVEELCAGVQEIVEASAENNHSRRETFAAIYAAALTACDRPSNDLPSLKSAPGVAIPSMSEPWFCCAEPTAEQLARL
jgi:radical SAM superfamily enzyme YgiQ (UPF0313 family)